MYTGRSNLNTYNRGQDANWQGSEDPHQVCNFVKAQAHITESFDITPINQNAAYGGTISFELDKRADRLQKVELVINRGAFTYGDGITPGAGFPDYEGYATINRVEFVYMNKTFHTVYGDELYYRTMRTMMQDQRTTIAHLQGGQLTDAERIVRGAAAQTWTVDLEVPWKHRRCTLILNALLNKIRVDVYFSSLDKIAGPATVSGCPITSAVLRCQYHHLYQPVREKIFSATKQKGGVVTKYSRSEFHKDEAILPTNANPNDPVRFTLNVCNIRNSVTEFWLVVRKQSDVNYTVRVPNKTPNPWALYPPTRFWLEDNGTPITKEQNIRDNLLIQNREAHPNGILGLGVPAISFCPPEFVEGSDTDCYGSRNFSAYNNLQLVVMYDQGLPNNEPLYLTARGDIHDMLIQENGDLRRFLQ